MSISTEPVAFGLVGLGGFGIWILNAIRRLEALNRVKLMAVCEPAQDLHAAKIAELRQHGVEVVGDFREMLKLPVQGLWLPVPIHLHRPFGEAALAAGKWVICEKPAAGTVQDIDAMIAARDRHHGKIAIAFQDVHERGTPLIKQRLLDGAIGRVERVSVVALAPRPAKYYQRNDWAGYLRHGDTWILDSPCTNAMAHSVNFPLFLLGPDMETSATPLSVQAELYRSRPIPSADTSCIRATTQDGVEVLLLMSHSCERAFGPEIVFYGSKGELHLDPAAAEFRYAKGRVERIARNAEIHRSAEVAMDHWTARPNPAAPLATLEVARCHTLIVNGAFDATPIHSIDLAQIRLTGSDGELLPCIPGIEQTFNECASRGVLPSESGTAPWSRPARQLDVASYSHFQGIHCR